MDELLRLLEEPLAAHMIATVVLLFGVLLGHVVARRLVRRSTKVTGQMRRRWLVSLRNVAVLVLLLGLVIIWASELRAVAISAVAIAAAIVIATKELIMCVSGTILEGTARAFEIGDRIEVDGIRGDVYDQTLLTTTLLEIGPGQTTHQNTGRLIVVPNSVFLTKPIINETSTDDYVLHTFTVPVRPDGDWRRWEAALRRAAQKECAEYLEDAKKHMEAVGQSRGIKPLSVEPRVTLQVQAPDRVDLVVRVPVPVQRRGRIEQAILRQVAETELGRSSGADESGQQEAEGP